MFSASTSAFCVQVTNPFVSGKMDNVINDLATRFLYKHRGKKIKISIFNALQASTACSWGEKKSSVLVNRTRIRFWHKFASPLWGSLCTVLFKNLRAVVSTGKWMLCASPHLQGRALLRRGNIVVPAGHPHKGRKFTT